MKVKSLSRVRLFETPWTVAYQAPPSMGFSRQEYWSGLPFPSPGDLPDPGIEPGSPTLQVDTLTSEPPGKPTLTLFKGYLLQYSWASLVAQLVKNLPTMRVTWVLGLGRSPGERKGYPLQYSGLEISMDCTVHGIAKSRTQLSDFH